LFCIACFTPTRAQEISFRDTITAYNLQRLHIDKKAEIIQCGWGAASIATGVPGYLSAGKDEWRYFHASNAAIGLVSIGYNGMRLIKTQRAIKGKPDYRLAYSNYVSAKRYYLFDAGFNLVLITSGIVMLEYGSSGKANPPFFSGLGRSFAIQGLFRLACDNIFYAAHQRNNIKWLNLLDEIRISGAGIGIDHTIK
jgi:hypothetical protein